MKLRLAIVNIVLPCITLLVLGFLPKHDFFLPDFVSTALIAFTLGRAFLLLQQQAVFSVLPMLLLSLPPAFQLTLDMFAPFAFPSFLLYMTVVNLQWGQRPWLHPIHLINLVLLVLFVCFALRLLPIPAVVLPYAYISLDWASVLLAALPLLFVRFWVRIGRWSSYWPLLVVVAFNFKWADENYLILWVSFAALFSLTIDSYLMAFVDELTGIPGRRAMEFKLKTLGRHYYLAMADVDHFKKFNDSYGHQVGDDVLKVIAKLISATPKANGYRYGGEEFCLVFAKSAQQDVMEALELTRKKIEEYELYPKSLERKKNKRGEKSKQKPLHITASFGVAQQSASEGFESVISRADKALYKAKQRGRNCVSVSK
ncbi:MAG: diguanylate cyclase (GGDEF)-like protein [Oceanicoccus sp.]|jgi:diguanylate cyclase (GGDEF)-like protein